MSKRLYVTTFCVLLYHFIQYARRWQPKLQENVPAETYAQVVVLLNLADILYGMLHIPPLP